MTLRHFWALTFSVAILGLGPHVQADGFTPPGLRNFARDMGIGFGQGYHTPSCAPTLRVHYNRVTGQSWTGYGLGYTQAAVGALKPGGRAMKVPDQTYFNYPRAHAAAVNGRVVCQSAPCCSNQIPPLYQTPDSRADGAAHQSTQPNASQPSASDSKSEADKEGAIEPYDKPGSLEKLPPVVEDVPARKVDVRMPPVPEPPKSAYGEREARVLPLLDPYHPRSASLAPIYGPTQPTYLQPVPIQYRPAQGVWQ